MRNILLSIIVTLSLSLQGCIFVAGAAAGAAAIAVVYDHRKIEKIVTDQSIVKKISNRILVNDDLSDTSHINVTSFNRIVLLTGETPTPGARQQAECIARSIPEVRKIYNQITIEGPSSSLSRSNDYWITTKIKTQMLATENLKSGTIKVVTENGTVYLMGIVSREQADVAVTIARETSGVEKVIRIFNYTN